jgi:hypothetical protein
MTGGDPRQAGIVGALSAGLTAGLGEAGYSGEGTQIGVSAVVGGTASEMSGGDFAEGAVQGAFQSASVIAIKLAIYSSYKQLVARNKYIASVRAGELKFPIPKRNQNANKELLVAGLTGVNVGGSGFFMDLSATVYDSKKGWFPSTETIGSVSTTLVGGGIQITFDTGVESRTNPINDVLVSLGLAKYLGITYNTELSRGSINIGLGLGLPLTFGTSLDNLLFDDE